MDPQTVPAHAAFPCPFCGTQPVIEKWHGGGLRKRRVGCDNEECPASPDVMGSTSGRALRKWNTRSPA